jgi:hypothetical protein
VCAGSAKWRGSRWKGAGDPKHILLSAREQQHRPSHATRDPAAPADDLRLRLIA